MKNPLPHSRAGALFRDRLLEDEAAAAVGAPDAVDGYVPRRAGNEVKFRIAARVPGKELHGVEGPAGDGSPGAAIAPEESANE
jgi:hypothetical protein